MPNNLKPGQYQIEDWIFGKGTVYPVAAFDIAEYGVQAGDFQVPNQDENRFGGSDQHIPGPITMTVQFLQNRWTHKVVHGTVLKSADAGKVQRIWRADGVRYTWGETQKLYYAGNDGIQKVLFGRTDKLKYPRFNEETDAYECTLSFRRGDNFSYSAHEYGIAFLPNQASQLLTNGTFGDAPSWMTLYLQGPMNDPQIEIAGFTFELDWDIPAGKVLEINSYPWTRRCVDSDGISRRANIIGATPYLDRLRFNYNQPVYGRVICNGTNANSKAVFMFRDAYQVIA